MVPVSSLGGGGGADSVEEVVEDDEKYTLSVTGGGGDLDGRRRSWRWEAPLPMMGRRVLETQRTMSSSDAHMDLVAGSGTPWVEAMSEDFAFWRTARRPLMSQNHKGRKRPELVLEGGMDAKMKDVMGRAGAHFENLDGSMNDRTRR
jgi:hypothetical protein